MDQQVAAPAKTWADFQPDGLMTLLPPIAGDSERIRDGFFGTELRWVYDERRKFEDAQNVGMAPGTSRCVREWFGGYRSDEIDNAWRLHITVQAIKRGVEVSP